MNNIDYVDLAKKYGTPLYVYDENKIIDIMKAYKENLVSDAFETVVLYASKALSIIKLYKLCMDNGIGADVVSGGEIYTAIKAGMNPNMLYFHGNNKTKAEIEFALKCGVNHLVVDSKEDFLLIESVAKSLNQKVSSLVRLNSGVEAHTHKFIVTSHVDSKFGMLINSDELNETLKLIEESEFVSLEGFHSHIGSQIFEMDGFYAAIDKILEYMQTFKKKLTLNIGGGFGAKYTDADHPIEIKELSKMLISHTTNTLNKLHMELQKLIIEPGRSIVCEAGTTLYTVGSTKTTPNRTYYFIDGGMSDNIRPSLYQALYSAFIVNKENAPKTVEATIAGKCCESGDIIIDKINLPLALRGDLLVVNSTGAYGYSMSSHYNKALRPAVVFVKDGKPSLAVVRETYEDLIRGEVNESI